MTKQIHREVQITHDEYIRQLDGALDGRDFRVEDDRIVVDDGGRDIVITLTDIGDRQLGSLALPMTRVTLSFHGHSDAEIEEFMAEYDRHKLRVGVV